MFLEELYEQQDWYANYVRLEIELLNLNGFGLDLSCCAATNANDNLAYVSPKTGRAVSEAAGAPYADKLLPLPSFLLAAEQQVKNDEIMAGLNLSGYFLQKYCFSPKNLALPTSRNILCKILANNAA